MDSRNPSAAGRAASPAGTVVNYEVHVLRGDRWLIEQSGTNETAMTEYAKEIARRREAAGVRLIREVHNVAEDRTACRVLFERLTATRPEEAGGAKSLKKATHRN